MHPTPADPESAIRTRRHLILAALAAAGAGIVGVHAPVLAAGAPLPPTPRISLGPFYPGTKPADSDADLTMVAGRSGRAAGTVLYASGRVLDTAGRPIGNAELEIWQANAFGRYHHPGDSDASGAFDPNFQGYGRLRSDAEGRYRIKTIKPPPYQGRTAHLHFNVASGGTRLTTQMFFDGETGNERDFLFRNLSRDDRLASTGRYADRTASMEPGAIVTVWDIVLRT